MTSIQYQSFIEQEKLAALAVVGMAHAFEEELRMLWFQGDGEGGGILLTIAKELDLPHSAR